MGLVVSVIQCTSMSIHKICQIFLINTPSDSTLHKSNPVLHKQNFIVHLKHLAMVNSLFRWEVNKNIG